MGEFVAGPKSKDMNPGAVEVLGISGSPVENSNTDRLIQLVLHSTGLKSEFIKLSDCKIEPCNVCMVDDPKWGRVFPCQLDNQCIIQDDFQNIMPKLLEADAIVIGGYPSYGFVDARTKTLLERMFALDHCAFQEKPLMTGKLGVSIAVCNTLEHGKNAAGEIEHMFRSLHMIPVAKIVARGSFPCRFRRECRVRHLEPVPLSPPEGIIRDPLNDKEVIREVQIAARVIMETLEIRRKGLRASL
jgi:multimeric flavodoxin WrbA